MQSKKQSFIESLTNIAIGYTISLLSLFIIFPVLGIESSTNKNILITCYFTVISMIRSYCIRRWFNKKKPVVKDDVDLVCKNCEIASDPWVDLKNGGISCGNCGYKW
jgi:hypothetical protein